MDDEPNGSCKPGAAQIDWVTGMVDTAGEPSDPSYALTPDERKLLRTNGKVGFVCAAIE